jgi:hypothetical protein
LPSVPRFRFPLSVFHLAADSRRKRSNDFFNILILFLKKIKK